MPADALALAADDRLAGLTLTVKDRNALRFDVELGRASVSLEALRKKQAKPLFVSEALTEQGTITFALEFIEDVPVITEIEEELEEPSKAPGARRASRAIWLAKLGT